MHFLKFEADKIDSCLDFIRRLQADQGSGSSDSQELCVIATGGGAYKHYEKIKEVAVQVIREDEMECLILGA